MQRLLILFLLLMLASCRTEDLLESICLTKPLATRGAVDSVSVKPYYVTAKETGGLKIGKVREHYLETFSVKNMGDALMDLKWRRPVNPTDGRIGLIANELIDISPYDLKPTHYYIKLMPKDSLQHEWATEDHGIFFRPIPFDHIVTGSGTLSASSPNLFSIPMYGLLPINETMQVRSDYEILATLYIPQLLTEELAADLGTPYLSRQFADVLLDQALYRSGARTYEELVGEKVWRPRGQVQVYDTFLQEYVGVPNVRVHIVSHGRDVCVTTDVNGDFFLPTWERDFKGTINYFVDWSGPDYKIFDRYNEELTHEKELAYYQSEDLTTPLYLYIKDGPQYCIATIARALYYHYYSDLNIWERMTDFRHDNYRFQIRYNHCYNPDKKGKFEWPIDKHITLWGVKKDGGWVESDELLSTTFHELGHSTMWYRAEKAGYHYDKNHKIIRESWANFIGWYMTKAVYGSYGCRLSQQISLLDKTQGCRIVFDIPNLYNKQNMTIETHKTDSYWKNYTPLFIDLIDDSNQKEYFRLRPVVSEGTYPDDRVVIDNYGLFYICCAASRNTTELKANLLKYCEQLGTTQNDINDYFTCYEN